jgi:hypothetical protein
VAVRRDILDPSVSGGSTFLGAGDPGARARSDGTQQQGRPQSCRGMRVPASSQTRCSSITRGSLRSVALGATSSSSDALVSK